MMKRSETHRFLIFTMLLILFAAQNSSARPKIGLALGGGGARGAAHIGVLRYLEAHNIPVDYIAGTSMGAIVGGMYASGYSVDEMEYQLAHMDWADILTDSPGYKDLSFRRKQDQSADLFDFELGVKGLKVMVPGGVITGQKVRFKLQTMTLHTSGIKSFDELPIPFRCIATDISTGDVVVLSQGNLAEAIHASFAIPGLIHPVNIHDRLLVDGGLVSNVPVNTVREMGADIVIAVNVGAGLKGQEELANLAAVTGQIVDLMIYNNVTEESKGADVLISPELTGLGSTQFEKIKEIIPHGYQAAQRVSEILRPYSVASQQYNNIRMRQKRRLHDDNPELGFMELENTSSVSNQWILANMHSQVGRELDLVTLQKDLGWLFQTNEFTLIDFRILESETKTGLRIMAKEKPWGNDTLRFGITLDENFQGDSFYGINFRYTNTRINSLGAEWRTDLRFGREGLFYSEFYQPLAHKTKYFASFSGLYHRFNANWYEEGRKLGDYRVHQYIGQIDFGVELGRYGEIRMGGFRGYFRGQLSTGQNLIGDPKVHMGGLHAAIVVDQRDDPAFPRNGVSFTSEYWAVLSLMGGEDDYQYITGSYQEYGSWGKNTVFGQVAAGARLGQSLPFYLQFDSSGMFSLSGYEQGAIAGDYFSVIRMGYFRELDLLPKVLGSGLYIGGFVEVGNALNELDDFETKDLIYTMNVFFGLKTFLGPLYLGYGSADTGKDSYYLKLGHRF